MTLHLRLPKELEVQIRHEVDSGMYASEGDVVCEALRLFFSQISDSGHLTEGEVLDTLVLPRLEALKNGTLETFPWNDEEVLRWQEEEIEEIETEQRRE